MIGLISTAMLHSSSTTTSIIVSLVGNGITLEQGIYMMMGANIGTTITNAMVAIGQMGDPDQLERAFGGAVVHDIYNYLSVVIMLPLELATGFLRHLSGAMVKNAESNEGSDQSTWAGPIKKYVSPIGERVIKSNSKLIVAVGDGSGTCTEGGGFYPILCEPGEPTYAKCKQVGLISCRKETGRCPIFFQPDATVKDDQISGGVVMVLSIGMLFICLLFLVYVLNRLLMGLSIRIIYKATNVNGYLSIIMGTGLTMLVQSSTVVTSVLTPVSLQLISYFLSSSLLTRLSPVLAFLVSWNWCYNH
jgi:sodium-dependent phosphate cotransporter